MNWFLLAFTRIIDFKGRSRRKEYWMFVLFVVIGFLGIAALSSIPGVEEVFSILLGIYILVIFLPWLSLTVRRLHDINKSGWYILVRFIPFVGGIWFLVLMCTNGYEGTNIYGKDPKADNFEDELDQIGVAQD